MGQAPRALPPAGAILQSRSRFLAKVPHLACLCRAKAVLGPFSPLAAHVEALIDLDDEAPHRMAGPFSGRHLPVYHATLSPIRFLALEPRRLPPLGLVFDRTNAGDEHLGDTLTDHIATGDFTRHLPDAACVIERLRALWRSLSAIRPQLSLPARPVFLVEPESRADQRWIADRGALDSFIDRALAEVPADQLVLYGRRGELDRVLQARGITLPAADRDDPALFSSAEAVWTWGSRTGFEALVAGAKVVTFGAPFYAGWGLTDDRAPHWAGRGTISLAHLIAATVLEAGLYADPVTACAVAPLQALERLETWATLMMRHFSPSGFTCLGIPRWKRPMMRAHLHASAVRFAGKSRAVGAGAGQVALWSYPPAMPELPEGSRTAFVEDGFLRSSGLGSDFHFPLSLVVDGRAMHFDAARPSDLEILLETHVFSDAEITAARTLTRLIVDGGLTKYNLGEATPATAAAQAQGIVLVAGQVPDDAAVTHGAAGIRTTPDLLRAVRDARPDAHIVFKEHPELVSGNRPGRTDPAALEGIVDAFVTQGGILAEIEKADEVHVISSLAGFEALLRGKRVVCWGRPFYAGWGLTEDRAPLARRTRRLTRDELVAGAMILYARYVEPTFGLPCSALDIAHLLRNAQKSAPGVLPAKGPLRYIGNALRYLNLVAGTDARAYWLPRPG